MHLGRKIFGAQGVEYHRVHGVVGLFRIVRDDLQVIDHAVVVVKPGAAVKHALAASRLELSHRQRREIFQATQLRLTDAGSRLRIDHAQSPELEAFARDQRHARIEADPGLAGDQRIAREPLVLMCIGHQQYPVLQDGMSAERHIPGRLCGVQAMVRLEPLPVVIDQRDQRDRCPEQVAGQAGDAIEGLLRCRVEYVQAP